jgi:hypothetical protein
VSHPRDIIYVQVEAERLKQEKEEWYGIHGHDVWLHELDTAACLALDGLEDNQQLRKVLVEAASYAIAAIEELDGA